MAARDEAPQAFDPHQGTTTVGGKHLAVDGGVFFLQLTHPLPGALVFDAADRQGELAVLVLLAEDEELAGFTGLENVFEGLNAVDRHFSQGHEGSCLGADVDQSTFGLQVEHGAVNNVTGFEVIVVLAEKGCEVLQREANVFVVGTGSALPVIGTGHLLRDVIGQVLGHGIKALLHIQQVVALLSCGALQFRLLCSAGLRRGGGHGHGGGAAACHTAGRMGLMTCSAPPKPHVDRPRYQLIFASWRLT